MESNNRKKTTFGAILALVGLTLLSFVAFLAFFSTVWYHQVYGDTGFDSVLYTLFSDLGGVQAGLIVDYLSGALLPTLLFTLGLALVLYLPRQRKWMPTKLVARVTTVVLSLALLISAAFDIGLVQYYYARMQLSELYENEYVDPDEAQIQFPEKKRNLIYIYLESMEATFLSQELGGAMEENLIPELTQLAQNNVNFSHNEGVGGLVEVPGASWSIGAMVAQTGGVPLITPSNVEDWQNGYGKDGVFLPGLTSLYNLLKDQGYYQSAMMGCDANFGGEGVYIKTHGVDKVYDLYTGRADGIVPGNYFAWWGFEDKYLFEYAKQELTKASQGDQPFAVTLLTMDTHHIDGYTCSLCDNKYDEPYENVLACSSKQVAAFIKWVQAQPFYENTTIILTGDHFSMDRGYFNRNVDPAYVRHGYNCIINAPVRAENSKNRVFSSLDMFPTTLAALGCEIQGNRLGFGVNLFSDQPTLLETYGYSAFCAELSKRTEYYEQFYKE